MPYTNYVGGAELIISFRPGVKEDVPYIKGTWLKGFRNGEGVRDCPNSIYYDYENVILQHLIPRCSNAQGIFMAYEALDPHATFLDKVEAPLLGYIVAEPMKDALLIHYVYVKGHDRGGKKKVEVDKFRKKGIAKALINHARAKLDCEGLPIRYTYRTPMCWTAFGWRTFLTRENATYVPYLKFTLMPPAWETGVPFHRKTSDT